MGLGDMAKNAADSAAKSAAESPADHRSVSADNSGQSTGSLGDGGNSDSYYNANSGSSADSEGSESGGADGGSSDAGNIGQNAAEKAGSSVGDKLGSAPKGSGGNGMNMSGASNSANNAASANTASASNASSAAAQSASAASGAASSAAAAGTAGAASGGATTIGSAIGSAISSAASAISGAIGSAFATVTSVGAAAASALSSAIGVAASTATAMVTTAAIASVATVGVVGVTGIITLNGTAASVDTLVEDEDCSTDVEQATASANSVDASAQMLANAKSLYSVFKTRGWSDNMIAGMLSNFQAEGSIDPTCIEGIYNEPYTMGTRKTNAVNTNFTSIISYLQGAYSGLSYGINWSAYTASDGNMYPGLGLCQWTGPGAKRLIDYAKSVNKNWYDLDFQIAYIIANGSPCLGTPFEEKYKSECGSADATTCAQFFAYKFENGNMPAAQVSTHIAHASSWASQMSSWSVDSSYANSVISMAQQMGASAASSTVANATKQCQKAGTYDNSSLANAAVSYAWPSTKAATGNNGTQLYQAVHDTVYPGDGYYMSCDRGVACAVRWSGTDIDYPAGGCSVQYEYCMSSDKWERVGILGQDIQYDQLQPGDVAILSGEHTWVYVGNAAVKSKYSNSNYTSVNASFGSRSAGCSDDSWSVSGDSRGRYTIFRCAKSDNSNKYKDAGAGKSGTS